MKYGDTLTPIVFPRILNMWIVYLTVNYVFEI